MRKGKAGKVKKREIAIQNKKSKEEMKRDNRKKVKELLNKLSELGFENGIRFEKDITNKEKIKTIRKKIFELRSKEVKNIEVKEIK